jgi:hypothetical protein
VGTSSARTERCSGQHTANATYIVTSARYPFYADAFGAGAGRSVRADGWHTVCSHAGPARAREPSRRDVAGASA